MRALVHIALLLTTGVVTILTVTPADGAESAGPALVDAIERAVSISGARVDSASEEKPVARTCPSREVIVPRAVDGSGRIAVKIVGVKAGGVPCEVWTWVRVRLVADVAVTRRAVRSGDSMADAVVMQTREVMPGRPPAQLQPGAVATRAIAAGAVVESDAVAAATVRPGDTVKILVVSGSLAVEQTGRATPCARGRSCAQLPSGKHVEGDLINGRLVVALP